MYTDTIFVQIKQFINCFLHFSSPALTTHMHPMTLSHLDCLVRSKRSAAKMSNSHSHGIPTSSLHPIILFYYIKVHKRTWTLGCTIRTKPWNSIYCFSLQLTLGTSSSKFFFEKFPIPTNYPPKPLKVSAIWKNKFWHRDLIYSSFCSSCQVEQL